MTKNDLMQLVFPILSQYRFGFIPDINLNDEEYKKDLINTTDKCMNYMIDLIEVTNPKTKKFKSYQNKLDDLVLLKQKLIEV